VLTGLSFSCVNRPSKFHLKVGLVIATHRSARERPRARTTTVCALCTAMPISALR
jgi:hypothetical protein